MSTADFKAEANQLSAQFGVCPIAARSVLAYLNERIQNVPQFAEIAKNGTDAQRAELMSAGMKAWHEHGQAFYNELLENKTEKAKKYRQMILDEVKAAAKAGKQ